jgi:hypothetical protein
VTERKAPVFKADPADEERLMKLAQALADFCNRTAIVENVEGDRVEVAPRVEKRLDS